MNLSHAESVSINGKLVDSIDIDGVRVWDYLGLILNSDKSFILDGETVLVTVTCEKLPNKEIGLYKVIGLTRTLLDTLTTDENGTASYTYTGSGAGEFGFVAVYDERDSNIVYIDDYVPAVTNVGLSIDNSNVSYGTSVTLTASVKDQHNQDITSGTVTFKDGSTTIGTASVTNGVATLTKSDFSIGSHSLTAEISNITSTAVSLSVNKWNTALSIVPPTLIYSDEFDVTGALTKSNGVGIVGATVTLLWNDGTDHTATATTTTDGAYSFHRDAPTSIRDYTFQVVYDGDTTYNNSSSSIETVTVGKETSVLNVTSPLNGSTFTSTFVVEGTLKDNDGVALANKPIKVYINGVLGTCDTDSSGAFSKSAISMVLHDGDNSVQVKFNGDDYYTSVQTDTITVVKSSYDGMSIEKSAGKQILSYADSGATPETEYCTVRVQLMNGSSSANISGIPVVFGAYQNDVLIGTTTSVNTDSNGQASYTYTSQGNGDIVIKAIPDNRTSLIQTYELQDCSKYDATEHSQSYGSSSTLTEIYDISSLSDCSVELQAQTSATNYLIGLGNSNTNITQHISYGSGESGYGGKWISNSYSQEGSQLTNYYTLKWVKQGTTMKLYLNNVEIINETASMVSILTHLVISSWGSKTLKYKELKIKPL